MNISILWKRSYEEDLKKKKHFINFAMKFGWKKGKHETIYIVEIFFFFFPKIIPFQNSGQNNFWQIAQ